MEKINYQKRLDIILEQIKKAGQVPSLLLHSCCGPCSSHCLNYLKDYFDITVYYFNPNIFPQEEYEHRLSEQIRLIDEMNKDGGREIKIIHKPYDHVVFTDFVKGLENEPEGGKRCEKCFQMRLLDSYEMAKSIHADYFATTLTVSPHKNSMIINPIGEMIADKENFGEEGDVKWLPSDFKKGDGYKKSIELSKKYDLYRQNYCGCEFSIWF